MIIFDFEDCAFLPHSIPCIKKKGLNGIKKH